MDYINTVKNFSGVNQKEDKVIEVMQKLRWSWYHAWGKKTLFASICHDGISFEKDNLIIKGLKIKCDDTNTEEEIPQTTFSLYSLDLESVLGLAANRLWLKRGKVYRNE